MADYIGLKLGNYRIVRLIGRGGFANVYQGEHIYLKTPAAIKVLKMQLIDDALEKFLQEARIIALLEHPHIVRILEFGVEGITPFLVMSYANNGTLRQHHSKNSSLPWNTLISYTRQVADALQYAHDNGVIHRDVKPENMLVDKNQRIQLSDFGLAIIAQNMNGQPSSSAGTTAYMAPEQLQGQPCRASDQYALGIIIYEWVCGSLPFTGSEREMTIQHLYAPPASLRTKAPLVSPAIEQIIMKTLAKDPQMRFASVQEFAQALEHAAISESLLDNSNKSTPLSKLSIGTSSPPLQGKIETVSSEEATLSPAHQQEPVNASSPSNFLPNLPLVVYDSPLTNNGRIFQPSLGSSTYSLEQPSLSTTFSSEDEAPAPSHASEGSLPPHTPLPLQVSDLAPLDLQKTTQEAGGNQPPLLTSQAHTSTSRNQHSNRHTTLIALLSIAIISLIVVAGIAIWTQSMSGKVKSPLAQLTVSPNPITNSANNVHKASSTPAALPTTGKAPASTPLPGVQQVTTPPPATSPLPVKAPVPVPTSPPAPTSIPGPTPVVPLTVSLVNPPSTATGGTTITIVAQASKGGVSIALNGKVRAFGIQTANNQGIASFQVKVPLNAIRMILTATAIDFNGDQVQSSPQIIQVD